MSHNFTANTGNAKYPRKLRVVFNIHEGYRAPWRCAAFFAEGWISDCSRNFLPPDWGVPGFSSSSFLFTEAFSCCQPPLIKAALFCIPYTSYPLCHLLPVGIIWLHLRHNSAWVSITKNRSNVFLRNALLPAKLCQPVDMHLKCGGTKKTQVLTYFVCVRVSVYLSGVCSCQNWFVLASEYLLQTSSINFLIEEL